MLDRTNRYLREVETNGGVVKIGFDSFFVHLDQITEAELNAFKVWNGGKLVAGKVQGGDAAFAGRKFLGGRHIWGPSEATDSRTTPHPEDPGLLNPRVPLIAPVQGPQRERQRATGTRGRLYGQINVQA